METRTHMLARLKEMRRKNHLGEFRNSKAKAVKSYSKSKKRAVSMVKHRRTHRKSGNVFNKLTSQKNIIGTVGGTVLAKYLGMPPAWGAAAGAYMYGKSGIVGAGVGFIAAPTIMNVTGKVMPSITTAASNGFGVTAY